MAAGLTHSVLAALGIFGGGYKRVDVSSHGRAVRYLQQTSGGRKLTRLIRSAFLPLCVATLWMTFTEPDGHAGWLRLGASTLFAMLALIGPFAFAALSYRRWVEILIAVSALCELVQITPQVPGKANILDFLSTAGLMSVVLLLGYGLRWMSLQDFEDRPLRAMPWRQSLGALPASRDAGGLRPS